MHGSPTPSSSRFQRGQGMAEYVIAMIAIAIVVLAIVVIFGGKIKGLFTVADAEIAMLGVADLGVGGSGGDDAPGGDDAGGDGSDPFSGDDGGGGGTGGSGGSGGSSDGSGSGNSSGGADSRGAFGGSGPGPTSSAGEGIASSGGGSGSSKSAKQARLDERRAQEAAKQDQADQWQAKVRAADEAERAQAGEKKRGGFGMNLMRFLLIVILLGGLAFIGRSAVGIIGGQ